MSFHQPFLQINNRKDNIYNMNFDEMSLDELKEYAKQNNVKVRNIGRAKLIEKLTGETSVCSMADDNDFVEDVKAESTPEPVAETKSTLGSIIDAIDDLEESDEYSMEVIEELPIDTVIPVRSITFGSLIYKSRSNNATYIWNEIGAVEHMTVAAITEMNNYNIDFLRKPMVILLDEKAVKYFRLTEVYENVAKINNLKQLFKTDLDNIEQTIDSVLKVGMRDILISKVRTMYKKKVLTDINVIHLLEKKLQFDLSDSNISDTN